MKISKTVFNVSVAFADSDEVGVPAFNVEKTIAKVVVEAQRYAGKVVVCDDGSMSMLAEIVSRNALKMRLSLYLLECSLA